MFGDAVCSPVKLGNEQCYCQGNIVSEIGGKTNKLQLNKLKTKPLLAFASAFFPNKRLYNIIKNR